MSVYQLLVLCWSTKVFFYPLLNVGVTCLLYLAYNVPITTAADDRYCDFREMKLDISYKLSVHIKYQALHARIKKVLSEGSNSDTVFLAYEGREDSNTTISGPSSAPQRNAI